jgi:hypothetical protein
VDEEAAVRESFDDHGAGGASLQHIADGMEAKPGGRGFFAVAIGAAGADDGRKFRFRIYRSIGGSVGKNPFLDDFEICVRNGLTVDSGGHLARGDLLPKEAFIRLSFDNHGTVETAAHRP